MSSLVTTSAVNMESTIPSASVCAKPLTRSGTQQIQNKRRDQRGDITVKDRGQRFLEILS